MCFHNQRIHSIGAAQAFRGYLSVAIFRVVIHPRRGQSRLHCILSWNSNIIDVQYPLNWDVTFCVFRGVWGSTISKKQVPHKKHLVEDYRW